MSTMSIPKEVQGLIWSGQPAARPTDQFQVHIILELAQTISAPFNFISCKVKEKNAGWTDGGRRVCK